MMNRDFRRTNGWNFRLRAAKIGEVSVRSLAALSLTVALPSGKARKAVPIIVLLALAAALALFLQADRNAAQAQSSNPSLVPVNWSLNPDDLGAGDKFRLLFLSSTKTDAMSTDIEDYNTFIKNLVAAGHADLDTYSEGFRVVGCTADVDARDNTGTNTNTDGAGVPIYWLNGSRVADDNAEFYDGHWVYEANDKNESGKQRPRYQPVQQPPLHRLRPQRHGVSFRWHVEGARRAFCAPRQSQQLHCQPRPSQLRLYHRQLQHASDVRALAGLRGGGADKPWEGVGVGEASVADGRGGWQL